MKRLYITLLCDALDSKAICLIAVYARNLEHVLSLRGTRYVNFLVFNKLDKDES